MKEIRKGEKVNEKIEILSKKIVDYSLKIKKNDRVLITATIDAKALILKLIEDINNKEAVAYVKLKDSEVTEALSNNINDKKLELLKKQSLEEVDNFDAFITIRYTTNDYEDKEVSHYNLTKISEALSEASYIRTNQKRWVLLNYPSFLDAYKAGMKTSTYANYAFDVMNLDYSDLEERIKPLKELMEKTDMVRIISPGTDLTFSIKDMNIIPCLGTCNLPDGEIYTAPVKTSVNGKITYNTISPYQGEVYKNVCLQFKDGKIINATCDGDLKKLNNIFDTDSGSRYVGEFSFGLNPLIKDPMGDILFDEKIIGSIHFTPGACYSDASNGNNSKIHWDLVLIQRKEYGGGEIYFDHDLIRKDGLFVKDELKHLNYNLK
jgi:aminopeptidase